MNHLSKWLAAPVIALACCLTGCGDNRGTTIIDAPQQTEQDIADADAAYDQQYSQGSKEYQQSQ